VFDLPQPDPEGEFLLISGRRLGDEPEDVCHLRLGSDGGEDAGGTVLGSPVEAHLGLVDGVLWW